MGADAYPAPATLGLEAEKSLLGAILIGGRESLARVDGLVNADSFGLEAHRTIWKAIAECEAEALGVDLVTVGTFLAGTMATERAGGDGYLAALLDRAPDVDSVVSYARLVREGAAWRRMKSHAAPPPAPARPTTILDALAEEERILRGRLEACRLDMAEIAGARRDSPGLWLDFDEVLSRRSNVGERLSLGFPRLDEKLEGGVYPGVVLTIQGKPGVGKTMLAIQWARNLGRNAAVAALFADEGLAGAGIALGQQLGADREPLIRNDEAAIAFALSAMKAEAKFFRALDPQHPEATLERMAADFDAMAPPTLPRIWLVDSAQVVRIAGPLTSRESPWDRIAKVVLVLRELAIRYRAVAILVSHVARSSYKEKTEDKQSDPLGSAAGSAAIERASELLVHLDGNPTVQNPRVVLRVVKNRISAGGTFLLPLTMNYARKSFLEVDADAETLETAAAEAAANLEALEKASEKIIKVLTGRDGISGAQLRKETKGRAEIFFEARLALQSAGKIHTRRRAGRGGGEEWFLGPAPIPPPEPGQIDFIELTDERKARGW